MSEGYALRRKKSCMDYETDCGTTWNDFVACCPSDSYCPGGESTTVCRKSHVGGELAIKTVNTGNSDTDGYVGCVMSDYGSVDWLSTLTVMRSGTVSSTPTTSATLSSFSTVSTTSSVSNTHTAKPTPSQSTNPSPPSSSTNIGAIAGGVVGGVAGAAILAALCQGAWGMQTVGNSSKFQQYPVQELDAGLGPTPPVYELSDATRNRQ
ncbi:hypothetical protein BDV39DRAFT_191310 [Aspergillus sergii]|uniref:Uncharacterized protein n=1 Tax=Aspergillus sergii TaxID=1034303 RepID=A0A5N6X984_9EURO|nr:hypothetical protein BDV39DRAFT_191310 [Aspergillus sergii]